MKLYYCNIDEISDLAGAELLSPRRREKMERLRNTGDRARCLAAGLLLRAALGEAALGIEEGAKGKPFLPGGPCFSLSHSGEYAVLGLSKRETGVDVQQIMAGRERAARRSCTAGELEWLGGQSDAAAFFRLWSAKESVMKATGLGFSLPPQSFSVLPVADGWHTVNGVGWFLRWLELPGHIVCTACAAEEPVETVKLCRGQLLAK